MEQVGLARVDSGSGPEDRAEQKRADAQRGFHEPFDGMGYLDYDPETPSTQS